MPILRRHQIVNHVHIFSFRSSSVESHFFNGMPIAASNVSIVLSAISCVGNAQVLFDKP